MIGRVLARWRHGLLLWRASAWPALLLALLLVVANLVAWQQLELRGRQLERRRAVAARRLARLPAPAPVRTAPGGGTAPDARLAGLLAVFSRHGFVRRQVQIRYGEQRQATLDLRVTGGYPPLRAALDEACALPGVGLVQLTVSRPGVGSTTLEATLQLTLEGGR